MAEEDWQTHKRYTRWMGKTEGETEYGLVSYWELWLAVNDRLQRARPSWEPWARGILAHERGTK